MYFITYCCRNQRDTTAWVIKAVRGGWRVVKKIQKPEDYLLLKTWVMTLRHKIFTY